MQNQVWTGKIAFASGKTGDYDIWTFDFASGALQQLTFGAWWNDKPKWSPDGRWVVFVSNRSGSQEIYKVPAAGGDAEQLTTLNGWTDSPTFSPNGSSIAFISNESGNNDIWLMDANGQQRMQVTRDAGSDEHVEWTADGQALLWSSDRSNGDADIWRYQIDTQEKTQLNADRGADITPTPHPHAPVIAFCSNRQHTANPSRPLEDRDKDLWLMSADGSWPVRLTENQGADFCPSWSPDGKFIIYTASDDRSPSRLRVLDVSPVVTAFATGDPQQINAAADKIRSAGVGLDRGPLKADIKAQRYTTLLTQWLPDKWVQSCYPPNYFGLERYPHWIGSQKGARLEDDVAQEPQPTTA